LIDVTELVLPAFYRNISVCGQAQKKKSEACVSV